MQSLCIFGGIFLKADISNPLHAILQLGPEPTTKHAAIYIYIYIYSIFVLNRSSPIAALLV